MIVKENTEADALSFPSLFRSVFCFIFLLLSSRTRVPVGYDELSKEQYIGGVYLREFLRAPQSQLRSTEKFVEVRSQANTSKHKHKQYLSCARLGMSILKPINLPRQARDKHREDAQKLFLWCSPPLSA